MDDAIGYIKQDIDQLYKGNTPADFRRYAAMLTTYIGDKVKSLPAVTEYELMLDLSHWSVMYWDTAKKVYVEKHDWDAFSASCDALGVRYISAKLGGANATSVYQDIGLPIIVKGLKQIGRVLTEGFWWFDPRVNFKKQIQQLRTSYDLAKPAKVDIDIEQVVAGISKQAYADAVAEFLPMADEAVGQYVGVYSAKWFWDTYLDGNRIKGEITPRRKWVAHYTTSRKDPYMPTYGWPVRDIWQYTDRLPVAGLASLGTDANHVKVGTW